MNKPYIELRTRNSFGDIINNYFTFLKYNFKNFTNLYLRYNAISIIFSLITSYLLVTGFMGLASRDFRFGMGSNSNGEAYLIAGAIVLVLVLLITSLINYSFSSSYISTYVSNSGEVTPKKVWKNITANIGPIILLILLGVAIYIGYIIVSFIFAFIPLLGVLIQYALSFTLAAFFGLTFMSIFSNTNSFGEALSEGWNLTFNNFINVVLYGLVIGILNLMITWIILSIPTFIIGIYIFFSAESNIDVFTNGFSTAVFTFGFAIFILAFIYSQALSQVAYGVLFFNLHEKKHNTFLREKIEQIGVNE